MYSCGLKDLRVGSNVEWCKRNGRAGLFVTSECMEINMANHVMGVATPVDNQLHQVIPVMQGTIGDKRASLVSARRLHNFLGVGRDFSNWIKSRISQYGFAENIDYTVIASSGENPLGGRPAVDYMVTIDMGKELAMVERNEKGRQVRRYFISCEQQAKSAISHTHPDFSNPALAARAWADEYEARQRIEALSHRQAQYIDHLENLFTDGLSPVQFCKRLNGVNVSKVSAFLQSANWLYDDNPNGNHAQWRVRSQVRDKYLTEKSTKVSPSAAASFTTYQPVLLRDGAVWLYRKYLKGQLPMKHSWNGEYTHDKELSGGIQ